MIIFPRMSCPRRDQDSYSSFYPLHDPYFCYGYHSPLNLQAGMPQRYDVNHLDAWWWDNNPLAMQIANESSQQLKKRINDQLKLFNDFDTNFKDTTTLKEAISNFQFISTKYIERCFFERNKDNPNNKKPWNRR